MRGTRLLIAFTAVLWVVLLANPIGRTYFFLEAPIIHLAGPDDPPGGNSLCRGLPSFEEMLRRYPDDPEVLIGFYDYDEVTQSQMAAEIERHPNDMALIAAYLRKACHNLQIGRYDGKYINPIYPKPFATYSKLYPKASSALEWSTFLQLANRASGLEPNNTFFDWLKMAALYALHRDAAALAVLNSTAAKTGYDDHSQDEQMAILRLDERYRPLTPTEQVCRVMFQLGYAGEREREAGFCIANQIVRFQHGGQNGMAIQAAGNLLHLGALERENSHMIQDTVPGVACEHLAIGLLVAHPRGIKNSRHFQMSALSPRMSQKISSEKMALTGWKSLRPDYHPEKVRMFLSALAQRTGTILLHGLAPCLLLLIICAFTTRHTPVPNEARLVSPWVGAVIGLALLTVLGLADLRSAWISAAQYIGYEYIMLGPQFSDYGPYFVDGLVAVVLTLLSLAQARKWQSRGVESRSALERSQKSDHRPSEFLELNLNLFMRLTAETSAWGAIFVLYIVVGPIRMTSPPSNVVTELCRHDDLILSIFWSVLLGISLVRLSRLPFRRQAFALALLNLRQLAAGYVLAASLLYAVTGLANIYVVERFDAAYQTYLQVGQNPTLRHQLGL